MYALHHRALLLSVSISKSVCKFDNLHHSHLTRFYSRTSSKWTFRMQYNRYLNYFINSWTNLNFIFSTLIFYFILVLLLKMDIVTKLLYKNPENLIFSSVIHFITKQFWYTCVYACVCERERMDTLFLHGFAFRWGFFFLTIIINVGP